MGGRKKRKEMFQKMLNELRGEKDEKIREREELKAKFKAMSADDKDFSKVHLKIQKLEADLQTEYFKILEGRGEDPKDHAVPQPKIPPSINKAYKETMIEEEARIA